jgi:hypothetical protein
LAIIFSVPGFMVSWYPFGIFQPPLNTRPHSTSFDMY